MQPFSARVKVRSGVPQVVSVTYWGSDGGDRSFDVLADGKVIGTQRLTASRPDAFFDVEYPLPADLLAGKTSVELTFRAHAKSTAGGVFGCRVLISE